MLRTTKPLSFFTKVNEMKRGWLYLSRPFKTVADIVELNDVAVAAALEPILTNGERCIRLGRPGDAHVF